MTNSTDTIPGFWFFSQKDRERMRAAAQTDWGKAIVKEMRSNIDERRTHDLAIPAQPGGHSHKYFCPKHNAGLRFDWDRPHEHYCKACGEYLRGESFDQGWINKMHGANSRYLKDCAYLHVVTGDPQLTNYIRAMLLDYAARYPGFPIHGREMEPDAPYGGRIYAQSLDESVWAISAAPAYVEARAAFTPAERENIERNLLRPCAEVILRNRADGNWQVWHDGGLAALGVALQDPEILRTAFDDPKCGFRVMMRRGVSADGWWSEGSPTYHFYPLRAMVAAAEAARCRGINLWDDLLERMFVTPLYGAYPDLTFPAHNDGWYGISLQAQVPLYEMAALRYPEAVELREFLEEIYKSKPRDSVEALVNGASIESDGKSLELESVVFRTTGVGILRDGTRTAVLKFGEHGGLHGHYDKLSLALHDGQREVLSDLGTCAYGVPDYAAWYRHSVAHSTVVVDRQNQHEATGTLLSFDKFKNGGAIEIGCDTAYPGVRMRRRVELRGGRLVDRFTCGAEAAHTFDYVLTLRQSVSPEGTGKPIDLGETPGYARIRNARQWEAKDAVRLSLGQATLTLRSKGPFTIITGEAPGVPGHGPAYPLLVRVHAKAMEVDATWEWGVKEAASGRK